MNLKNNSLDYTISSIKAVLGTLPAGSIVSELICNFIPQQRLDKVVNFITELSSKIENIEKNKFNDPKFIDLLEDGINQAMKAISKERIEHIANIISVSLSEEVIQHDKYKRYLSILAELTDTEIIILGYYVYSINKYPEYYERYKSILKKTAPTFSCGNNIIEEYEIYKSNKHHLAQLGLLVPI